MKIISIFFVILLAPMSCLNVSSIPEFFKAENISWDSTDKVFILVRHAEKEKIKGKDPHLTEEGLARAQKLSEIVDGINKMDIYSSDYFRTKETVAPLAEKINKEVSIYNARDLDSFASELNSKEAGIHLISGHSNTTPNLANKLCDCNFFPKIDESDYTNVYVVVQSDMESNTYVLNY